MKALSYATDDLAAAAEIIAKQFGFQLNQHQLPRLNLTHQRLELLTGRFAPLYVDFAREAWLPRLQRAKQHSLVRACKPVRGMRIIDATAGWGRDAALLAAGGAEVMMLEHQPLMAALLSDALQRNRQSEQPLSLDLCFTDAAAYLTQLPSNDWPHVIYLDPMHPVRTKSALVKKDMQILQQFFGPDEDIERLLNIARQRARQRVVVKWPQRLPAISAPNFSVEGKTVRFDVYLNLNNTHID